MTTCLNSNILITIKRLQHYYFYYSIDNHIIKKYNFDLFWKTINSK